MFLLLSSRPSTIYNQLVLVLFIVSFTTACSTYSGKSFVPVIEGYHENNREVYILKKKLLEISGIVYLQNDTVAAINDEKGQLFILDLKSNESSKYEFKGKDDYEDLARTDSFYYVLESDGDIHELSFPPDVRSTSYNFPEGGRKIEFESLVWYKKLNKLVLITKDQREGDQEASIDVYSFDLSRKQFDTAFLFQIPLKEIYTRMENFSTECKPSGAAIHPFTGKLYIIASIGKLLLECTMDGKLEKIYKLNPTHFPQPEGISFANNGDMYIANEGLDGKATILKFPYSGRK